MLKSNIRNCFFWVFIFHYLTNSNYVFCLYEKIIKDLQINQNSLSVVINDSFKQRFLTQDFFVQYDEDIDLKQIDESLVTIPFLLNIISLIWYSGKIYEIDVLDENLYLSLKKIKLIFRKMYPDINWNGELKPIKLKKNELDLEKKDYIALPFTCGVDSTFASMKIKDKQQLLITIFEKSRANSQSSLRLKEDVISYSKANGFENRFIISNFLSFLKQSYLNNLSIQIPVWRTGAIEDLGWIGLCAPILISKKIPLLYVASSFTYKYEYPTLGNPIIDSHLKYANISAQLDDFITTRTEKVKYIIKNIKTDSNNKITFRVCDFADNCCRCEKCLRTINNILANNEDYTKFGFNLEQTKLVEFMLDLVKKPFRQPLVYFYKDIQNKFKELILLDVNEQTKNYITWFLSINFDNLLSEKEKRRKKINWLKFQQALENQNFL